MTPDHERLRDLVLAYEDLEPEEKREADAHLAGCAACGELLARVRAAEQAPRAAGALPEDLAAAGARLSAPEARAAAESLDALRDRAGLLGPAGSASPHSARRGAEGLADAPGSRRGPARRRWIFAAAPAAAAAILLLVVLRAPQREEGPFGALRFALYSMDRGGDSGARGSGSVWRTGDRFVLHFDATAPSYPVVFLLDPAGEFTLLHPPDPDDAIPLVEPGTAQELPPKSSGEAWLFLGATGRETFFVADAGRARAPLGDVLGGAAVGSRAIAGRAKQVRMLTDYLERHVGPTRIIEAEHQP